MIPLPTVPTQDGVFCPLQHAAVYAMADRIAADARIPEGFLWARLPRYCSVPELEWARSVRSLRQEGCCGLAYIGDAGFDPTIDERMCALAGAFSRLQVRARVFSPTELVERIQHDGAPEATCLLVPGFVPYSDAWATKQNWARAALGDLVVGRGKGPRSLTVVAAPSWKAVADAYGPYVRDHIREHYREISPPATPMLPRDTPFAMTLDAAEAAMALAKQDGDAL